MNSEKKCTVDSMYTDGRYLINNLSWHEEDSPWKAGQILKMIERNKLEFESVCEVGCGAGEILNQLTLMFSNNVQCCGYEISPHAYELSIKKEKENLKFFLQDFLDTNSFYDILLLIDVIEHVPDYLSFLKKIKTKSKYKIFHIPLDMTVLKILMDEQIKRRHSLGHLHYFSKETAIASLLDTNYEILDYFYTSITMDLQMKTYKMKFAKLGFKISDNILSYLSNKDFSVKILGGHSLMVLAV